MVKVDTAGRETAVVKQGLHHVWKNKMWRVKWGGGTNPDEGPENMGKQI